MSDAVENLKKKALEKAYKKDSKGHPKLEEEAALLRGMAEMFEEWKPFPKDKVNKQIDKVKKKGGEQNKVRKMTAVKNFRTKMTDVHKATQKFTGSDVSKQISKENQHLDKKKEIINKLDKKDDKALEKMEKGKKSQKKKDKIWNKNIKKTGNLAAAGNRANNRADAMGSVRVASIRNSHKYDNDDGKGRTSDNERQAEVNRKNKADRTTAKSGLNRASLEGALKAKPKREKMKGPAIKNTIKKESMNFSEFLDSSVLPLYEKEGEIPKCPPGYRYDVKLVMCVPKTPKDSVGKGEKSGDKDSKPGQGAHYNVWGNTGVDGAGYAWEEGPTNNDKASGAYG
jgi:hypothetical protein